MEEDDRHIVSSLNYKSTVSPGFFFLVSFHFTTGLCLSFVHSWMDDVIQGLKS